MLDIEQKISETYKADQRRSAEMARLQATMRDHSDTNHQKEALINERRITSARLEQKKEDVENEMKQELGIERYTHIVKIKRRDGDPVSTTDVFPHIQRLRKQLEHIGEVDETIVSEHTETQDRFVFLSEQSKDLHSSITHLQRITHELDEKIETQFAQSFKHINQHFSHYFKTLFGGGKASLSYQRNKDEQKTMNKKQDTPHTTNHYLTDKNEEPETQNPTPETIIEITACPPNKKVTNIMALSGGERSLTAIALLCAIIASNPAPFIVLDEVDAALDEANSERFAAILENLSHLTQFIAITHNRSTMHKAHLLYGVTMNEDASSRLFSVKLEEALAH